MIKPQYESRATYFSNNTLIPSKKGKKGLVDYKNKVIVPFEYDQILPWSDSAALVLNGKFWSVLNYHTNETEFGDITGLEWISNNSNRKAIIKTNQGYGLLDNQSGILLKPGFNDIINLGTVKEPVFFTEKYIPEADYFVVIYYNHKWKLSENRYSIPATMIRFIATNYLNFFISPLFTWPNSFLDLCLSQVPECTIPDTFGNAIANIIASLK